LITLSGEYSVLRLEKHFVTESCICIVMTVSGGDEVCAVSFHFLLSVSWGQQVGLLLFWCALYIGTTVNLLKPTGCVMHQQV